MLTSAIAFFIACQNRQCAEGVCRESRVPASWARAKIGSPDDYVEPYFFDDPYRKKTGLWLKAVYRP